MGTRDAEDVVPYNCYRYISKLGTRAAGSTRRRTIGLRKTDILRRGGPWSSRFLHLVILSGGASPSPTNLVESLLFVGAENVRSI